MNIVVLAGGISTERDVSFKSGSMITAALRRNGHKVIMLDVFMGIGDSEQSWSVDDFERGEELSVVTADIPTTAPDLKAIKASRPDQSDRFFGPNVLALCSIADIVFLGLHGENGENGKVQATLDLFGIKYTGDDYISCANSMNKAITKKFFEMADIPTPVGFELKKSERGTAKDAPVFPCVVKPACGGSSIGVTIVNDRADYDAALDAAFTWEDLVVVEQYIDGRELSCGVLEHTALPPIEIAPIEGFYDYKNKYKAGSAVETCPAKVPENIFKAMQHYAEQASVVLGLDVYSRMDFMYDEKAGKVYCLEANTLPGMTPTSLLPQEAAAVGIDFDQLCEEIIKLSFKRYGK